VHNFSVNWSQEGICKHFHEDVTENHAERNKEDKISYKKREVREEGIRLVDLKVV
jgi:hypothetical protein